MLSADEREAYLSLALVPGVGGARLAVLREQFGSYRVALRASPEQLAPLAAFPPAVVTAFAERDVWALDRMHETLERVDGRVLLPEDAEFPSVLRDLEEPPIWLFVQGRLDLLDGKGLAIVGTRHPTAYGVEVTKSLSQAVAAANITVVSGMASGLDAVAHWAAVDGPASTIGVLGTGLGVVYPATNFQLFRKVSDLGLLVTECPPSARPTPGSFPRRNRLIAALSRATLVVEGNLKSGARITAEAANALGREVFAVPGPITSRSSLGTNQLIRDGAHPYLEPADLGICFPSLARAKGASLAAGRPLQILEALDGVPRSVDQLATELGFDTVAVLRTLTELEVAGLAERQPAGFVRAS